ncbi:site-specific integrase [Amycolatopsis anabasis]|uniref:site-specific integrase n=1 Tax=Amycolatopsis anabasis TaxID=1840409 RepID=UPI001C5554A8|nr:site-specific integrase [Amycolatopsis anabasis]
MTDRAQTLDQSAEVDTGADAPATFHGEAARKLVLRFPARTRPDSWPTTAASRAEILTLIDQPQMRAGERRTQDARRYGVKRLLRWLETFPGSTWQERWQASSASSLGSQWLQVLVTWLDGRGERPRSAELKSGLLCLLAADVIRPDLEFLMQTHRSWQFREAIATHRDPVGFARLAEVCDSDMLVSRRWRTALGQIATIITAKGGHVADITVGDCLELRRVEHDTLKRGGHSRFQFYALLKDLGLFPSDAPATLRMFTKFSGQVTPQQLVDRYRPECRPIRDLFVDYITERQPTLDYTSLQTLAYALVSMFWKDLENHHPRIDSLRLPQEVVTAWKQRISTKVTRRRLPDGTVLEVRSPRDSYLDILSYVRGFYLDLAEWAQEDPARWGPWAAPNPVSSREISYKKHDSRVKAKMDQRTRERLPVLPTLVRAAEQRLRDARARLEAVRAATARSSFTVLGETFLKAASRDDGDPNASVVAYDQSGRRRYFGQEEHRAFWGWAAIEFLRHTGTRIEEMLETSHHSITQYILPTSGERIPLLQIAPSKTDLERLLVVSPELADVLSVIISRIRRDNGAVPLVPFHDVLEKVWMEPLPLLFQWRSGGENRAISPSLIRKAINEILADTGLTDATGQPLHFQPHDFRRIFATEAIMNGMPPHIAQLILGHQDINTTMGYKAVYPEEAINGHRAFIARRRALRPAEEYRVPTDEEWDEFLGHFQRRKVALGDCGRAYGTSCQHEHSCIRCPLLRVDPKEKPRLIEIRDNLTDRIEEAEREGWLGEAEGLHVSLSAANDKLAYLERRAHRATTINLGLPTFGEIIGRTATLPARPTRQAPALDTVS